MVGHIGRGVVVGAFAVLMGGFSGVSNAATIQTINPSADGYVWDNAPSSGTIAPDGLGDGNYGGGTVSGVGELDSSTLNRLERMIIKFTLPTVPAGEEISSVHLRVYLFTKTSNGNIGNAVLYHRQANLAYNLADNYYEASFPDGGVIVATSTTPSGYIDIDVTSWVLADYQLDAAGTAASHFRIQMDGAGFINDDKENRYLFYETENSTGKPQLVITSVAVPEVATLSLVVACGGLLMKRRA